MPTLNDVLAGSQAQAVQVQQIIDALKGTPNKGVPVALVSLNDPNNYALTVQNDDPVNSRALSVLKADGTTLISADATGVTLGAPVNLPPGSISGSAIAAGSITNAMLGADVARANLLTNGGFEIWQRGNGPFGAATGTADKWGANIAGVDTISVSKDTTNVDTGSLACAVVVYTRSTGGSNVSQALNDSIKALGGRVVSFSARVRTSTANAVRLRIYDNITGSTYSAYHAGSGAYQTLTVTATISSSASVTAVAADFIFDQSCTAYLDNAMLVVGSQAANYVPMHPADDLARCLRYYELLAVANDNSLSLMGIATASGQFAETTPLHRAIKPVTPTVTVVGSWAVVGCAQPAAIAFSTSVTRLRITSTGAVQFFASNSGANTTVSVESNP